MSSGWLNFNTTTFSVAYSRMIIGQRRQSKFHLLVGVNFGGRIFVAKKEAHENYYFCTPKVNMLIGSFNRFFEIELGVMKLLNYPKTLRDGGHTYTRYTEYANVKFGYRYQPKDGGLLFRVGLGYPTGLYLGIGLVL